MNFKWTDEQESIFKAAADPTIQLIQVLAVAGASKTTILIEVANRLKASKMTYMTFSKPMAEEAKGKFPKGLVDCRTIHSMAYKHVVRPYGLNVGGFYPRNIAEPMQYKEKMEVVATLDDFCLSAYLTFDGYKANTKVPAHIADTVETCLDAMFMGTMQCSHSFYLKIFHVFLADGTIELDELDLLMIDEAGDLTELTIEIFKLLPSKKKIMVGDPKQSIFSFMKCKNAFEVFKDYGYIAPLSKSFRVSAPLASKVQTFVRSLLDEDFVFTGTDYSDDFVPKTTGYIARTNSGLLDKMFSLMKANTRFNTTKPVEVVLAIPIAIANMGNGKKLIGPEFNVIEHARATWEKYDYIHKSHTSIQAFLRSRLDSEKDEELLNAFDVLYKYGPSKLNQLVKFSIECSKEAHDITLTTIHSSKGLEWDSIIVSPDADLGLVKSIRNLRMARVEEAAKKIEKYEEDIRLHYVLFTRARVSVEGSSVLDSIRGPIVG